VRLAVALALATGAVGAAPVLGATPSASAVATAGYPYTDPAAYPDGSADPAGWQVRSCTSYVAWWLATHRGIHLTATGWTGPNGSGVAWGDAAGWALTAAQVGVGVGTGSGAIPVVGAVAQFDANATLTGPSLSGGTMTTTWGPRGHVGIVTRVYGSDLIEVESYDGDTGRPTVTVTTPQHFLYLGVARPASMPAPYGRATPGPPAPPAAGPAPGGAGATVTNGTRVYAPPPPAYLPAGALPTPAAVPDPQIAAEDVAPDPATPDLATPDLGAVVAGATADPVAGALADEQPTQLRTVAAVRRATGVPRTATVLVLCATLLLGAAVVRQLRTNAAEQPRARHRATPAGGRRH
jgi:surface antigen